MTEGLPAGDRYVVISADCHGGAALVEYRNYLEAEHLDAFDAWASEYVSPHPDLEGPDAERNWNSGRRVGELEEDGIVAEVVFPNTIPPFYPQSSLKAQPPPANAGDLELRWAGLHAHNRWLADFCAEVPERRAGIAQILLNDVPRAVEELEWAAAAGLRGGLLLPGAPEGSGVPPLYAAEYEPIWAACEDLGLPVNHHSGSAVPVLPDYPESNVIFLLEVTWYAHRALWHLVFGGALERHPRMQLVFTEQGTAWLPETLMTLDYFYDRMSGATGSQEMAWGLPVVEKLSLRPSEYWARQCHVGASFMRPAEAPLRHVVGLDHVMWGSDYPHREASYPYSRAALRAAFADVPPAEVQQLVGANAARVYGFDLAALAPHARRIGPTVDEVATPLAPDELPTDAEKCPALAREALATR